MSCSECDVKFLHDAEALHAGHSLLLCVGDGIDPDKVNDCAANSLSKCPEGCCYSPVWQVCGRYLGVGEAAGQGSGFVGWRRAKVLALAAEEGCLR
jgi:hypothetical protein